LIIILKSFLFKTIGVLNKKIGYASFIPFLKKMKIIFIFFKNCLLWFFPGRKKSG